MRPAIFGRGLGRRPRVIRDRFRLYDADVYLLRPFIWNVRPGILQPTSAMIVPIFCSAPYIVLDILAAVVAA